MPSALETLVKILKLERQQGCKNTAVIGGLNAYSEKWSIDAHKQARRDEHHLLVDELVDLMRKYEGIDNKTLRHKHIKYMLDRITGRVPPSPEYAPKEQPAQPGQQTAKPPDSRPPKRAERPPKRQETRPKPAPPPAEIFYEEEQILEGEKAGDIGEDDSFNEQVHPRQEPRKYYSEPGSLDIPPEPRLARAPRRPRPNIDPEEAVALLRELKQPVTAVKGIGPRVAQTLEKLDIHSINDMLFYLPRRYDDYTRLVPISKLLPNNVYTVIGTVDHTEVRIGKGGRKDFFLLLDDGSGKLNTMFFGQHFLIRSIRKGQQIVLSGQATIFGQRLQMVNPEWEPLDSEKLHTTGIVPVYPLSKDVKARMLRRHMKHVVDAWANKIPDYIPEATLERAELADIGWAIRNLHFPEGWDHLEHAKRRFIFDELLTLQLAVLANRREWQSVPGQPLEVTDDFLESFISSVFPYELTGAQKRSIADIRRDIATDRPMNRLLQGDVGSGKTAVATVAMAMALANGKQAAIMAPTSILAEQHYRGISAMLEQMPGDQRPVVALLTSALTTSERQSVYRGLADGSIDLTIGTHALIQEGVEFKDLALAVIDEQHRFGVEQRKALRGKGTNPHLLVMTATPIPRTLALTIYADLDLSILDEKPPGRQPVQTRYVEPVARERVYRFVERQLQEGRQAFIVHPLVEVSDKIEAASAVEAYERLRDVFFRFRVCLLHGRMPATEKEDVMAAFANGEYDVMVTTTVAEVGVDVPNASIMVIEDANRFGLAQLHQLRGRVGRGAHTSYCLLVAESGSDEANERLKAMENISDGFKLAEIDWKLRGAGDLVGTRQSGQQTLQLAEEMTPELVEMAQREARTIYEEDPDLSLPQHRLLAQRVAIRHDERTDVS